jgi:helix-turn-helix protein
MVSQDPALIEIVASAELQAARTDPDVIAIEAAEAPEAPDVLTPKEAAAYLRVSFYWLKFMRLNGRGPVYIQSSSRYIRYRRVDLQVWLSQHAQQPRLSPARRKLALKTHKVAPTPRKSLPETHKVAPAPRESLSAASKPASHD